MNETGPMSARTATHRGQPIQEALYNMGEQITRKKNKKAEEIQFNEQKKIQAA